MGTVSIRHVAPGQPRVTIQLCGELDSSVGAELQQVLVAVIRHACPAHIVVDLSAVTTVDALVVGMLRTAAELAREAHLAFAFEGSGAPLADRLIREELTAAA